MEVMDFDEVFKATDNAVLKKTNRHLKDIEVAILRAAWQRKNYNQIAEAQGYTPEYLKHDVGPKLWKILSESLGEKVTKINFRGALERCLKLSMDNHSTQILETQELIQSELDSVVEEKQVFEFGVSKKLLMTKRQDWGEAVDVSVFYGRTTELAQLEQWIVQDQCRLVALLGMGGIGKTALSVRSAQQLQDNFEYVIWRSLRHTPPFEEFLADLLQFLDNQPECHLPESLDGRISRVIDCLRRHRCLLILDDYQGVLHSRDSTRHNSETCREYSKLLRRVAEIVHQSCLVITSRQQPQELALLEGKTLAVRSLKMKGLKEVEGQKILMDKGLFFGSKSDWEVLISHYSGNPFLLKIVAHVIQQLFSGNILQFLNQKVFVFGEIRTFLDEYFWNLSDLEQQIMCWMAIQYQPITIANLYYSLFPIVEKAKIFEALISLQHKYLIEKVADKFGQELIVMEYVIQQLIEHVSEEMHTENLVVSREEFLIKETAIDCNRSSGASGVHHLIDLDRNISKSNFSVSAIVTKSMDMKY